MQILIDFMQNVLLNEPCWVNNEACDVVTDFPGVNVIYLDLVHNDNEYNNH